MSLLNVFWNSKRPLQVATWLPVLTLALLALALGCNEKGKTGLSGKPADTLAKVAPADPVALAVAEEGSRAAVEQILTLVKVESPQELAAHLAYKGADKSQHYRRAYDYTSEVEKVDVDKSFAKLQVLLLGMQTVDYNSFVQERESEGIWNVWQLTFHYEDGSAEQVSMAMVDVGGDYLLADLR